MRYAFVFMILLFLTSPGYSFISDKEIVAIQKEMSQKPVGERIARWAEQFLGTPYDPDPQGEYVTKKVIVADERVDCMYLIFRSVELALSNSPEEAIHVALEKRFFDKGILSENGTVSNYDQRFQYAMDMLRSGKWGRATTDAHPLSTVIEGSRGVDTVRILPWATLLSSLKKLAMPKISVALQSGDIVYFVKDPEKRVVGEIVGHIGILKREKDDLYLIHASGSKNLGGTVKKVPFADYVSSMPFIGIIVGRL
jgi:hypothetical protein